MKDMVQKLQAKKIYATIAVLFASLFLANSVFGQESITVTPNFTNHYAGFEIRFDLSNGAGGEDGNQFTVTFDDSIRVPSSISPSAITVANRNQGGSTTASTSSGNPSSVTVTGQTITFDSPVNFLTTGGGDSQLNAVTITVSANAEIQLPSVPSSTINVLASINNSKADSYTEDVTVVQTTTTVSQASVSPNTSVENRIARYTIGFTTGAGGYLNTTNSTITLTFPAESTLPDGGISGITINNTATTANGNNTDKTIVMSIPSEIKNEQAVSIVIPKSSGVSNPVVGTGYTLDVFTSSEPTSVTSAGFNISSAENLSFSSIDATDDTVNAFSAYDIQFVVSTAGKLDPAFGDLIVLKAPARMSLPASISTSDVTVNNITTGFSNSANSVSVGADSITIGTPVLVNNEDEVRVSFALNAGLVNPDTAGNYYFNAVTYESNGNVKIDDETISNPYSIVSAVSTLENIDVVPTDPAAGVATNYTITANVGRNGRLVEDSKINFIFPTGTDLSTITGATVDGVTATATQINSSDSLQITVPASVEIPNSEPFEVVINNITSPGSGSYSLEVNTSSETSYVFSSSYTIGGTPMTSVTVAQAGTGAGLVNRVAEYQLTLTGASDINLPPENSGEKITVRFPSGTTVPSDITLADVQLNGSAATNNASGISVDANNRTVIFTISTQRFSPTSITFLESAGIVNPSVPRTDFYTISVKTTQNSQYRESGFYTVLGSTDSPTITSVVANPSSQGSTAGYTIDFTTGAFGNIIGGTSAGSDTVTVNFGNGITVPGSVSNSDIKIDGNSLGGIISISSGSPGIVVFRMPSGVEVDNSSAGQITVSPDAGFVNNTTAGDYTVTLKTSSETSFSTQTNNLTIDVEVPLAVNSVNVSPTGTNANGSYTIKFAPGTAEELAIGDSVIVTFPSNTHVPSSIAKTSVQINSTALTVNPVISGRRISIATPVALAAEAEATLQISTSANILNPSTAGTSYRLDLATSKEAATQSPTYSITQSSSTISKASVNPNNSTPSSTNVSYTIDFSTGTYGRLIAGTSTFSVRFPASFAIGGGFSASVNGVNSGSVTNPTGNVVEIQVPSTVDIGNNGTVTVVVTGITNPASAGNYTLDAKTSVENSYVTSSEFPINNIAPVTLSNLVLSDDTVNVAPDYTLDIAIDQNLTADNDEITLVFPEGTLIPNSINVADITVNTLAASAITTYSLSRQVTITVPDSYTAPATLSLSIALSSGIKNPSEPANDYYIIAKTSQQTKNDTSAVYSIVASQTTKLSGLQVGASPDVTDEPVNWEWQFTTGSKGALDDGRSTIFLDYGDNTFTKATVDPSTVTVNTVTASQVSRNGQVLEVVVPSGVTIGNNSSVTVNISSAAGIQIDPEAAPKAVSSRKGFTPDEIQNESTYGASTSAEPNPDSQTTNPLPVELLSFNVNVNADDQPTLVWSTATERENYGFHIQRTDENSDQFSTIAFVEGVGYSTEKQTYRYTDESVNSAGDYTYRIIQEDFDGTQTEIAKQTFTFEKPNQTEVFANYPNPFNPATTIRYNLANAGKVQAFVYNVIGQKVATLVDTRQEPGKYTVQFNANRLSSGVYFLYFQTQGITKTQKMLLVK